MNIVNLLKLGQQYMQICPNDKQLAFSFPEIKIIAYIKLAVKYVPPIIIILLIWHYYMHANMISTLITVLFAVSLPIQGYLWLGKRASAPLPLTLLDWYITTREKLVNKQIIAQAKQAHNTINFMDFMRLFNLARVHLNDDVDSY